MKFGLSIVLLLLVAPGVARAELATIVSRDVPLAGGRALASSAGPERFNLVGLHWQGSGSVSFRTRSPSGRWSAWRTAAPEAEDGPDRGSGERRVGWRLGNPYWTGTASRIEYRTRGQVTRLRAWFVWSPASAVPPRTVQIANAPQIVPRLSWGANEAIRRAPPAYAPSLQLAIVHHTAGTNSYTRAQSAAIVRGIQLYHVRGNGWNDIGYNFLVDQYGQVFEGRFGGVERNVIGAHAEGFNTGSAGFAVVGNYDGTAISAAARSALVSAIAWRLDVAHVDPLTTVSAVSGGNPRYPRGVPVFLRAIVGHRDTGFTDCPGDALYNSLSALARAIAASGAPKLYAPAARGSLGGPIRFTARLSTALPWKVTVTDAQGKPVAQGTGTGTAVDWTWDATTAPPGAYGYTMEAGPTVRPATGSLGARNAALTLTRVRATPAAVTPNGDGRDDATTISYTLGAPATVTATLVDQLGATLATLFSEPKTAGPQSFAFAAEGVPDGTYRIVLTAVGTNGRQATGEVQVLVNRTLSGFSPARAAFSPNADGRADTLRLAFHLAGAAQARLRVLRGATEVASVFAGPLPAGAQAFTWDGRGPRGRVPDGAYEAEISVTTATGTVAQRAPVVVDTRRPELRLVRVRPLSFRVSEAAEVALVIDGRRVVVKPGAPGVYAVPNARAPRRVRALAYDRAGNVSRVARFP